MSLQCFSTITVSAVHKINFGCYPQADAAAARFLTLYTAIYEIPYVFLAFLWGSYTDYVGRKRALIVPVLGSFIRALTNLIVAAFQLNLAVLYVGCAIEGFFGGPAVFTGAVFAYIADITPTGSRSQRTVVIQAMLVFGLALSQIIQGYLVQFWGFVFTYTITAAAIGLNLVYVTCWVLESVQDIKPCSFFRFDHVKKTVLLFFKDDGTNRLRKMQVNEGKPTSGCGLLREKTTWNQSLAEWRMHASVN